MSDRHPLCVDFGDFEISAPSKRYMLTKAGSIERSVAKLVARGFPKELTGESMGHVIAFLPRLIRELRRLCLETDDYFTAFLVFYHLESDVERINSAARRPVIATGIKQRRYLAKTRDQANSKRRSDSAKKWAICQREADDIWKRRPHLSSGDVAALIRRELNLTDRVDTIRRRIKKPKPVTAG